METRQRKYQLPHLHRSLDPTQAYTLDDLKAAYRRQAMTKHPDQGGDPVEFQQLTEIYNLMAQAFERTPPQSEGSAI